MYAVPARRNVEFFLLKWNFSLTKRCKNKRNTQQWSKRIGCFVKRRLFIWFWCQNFAVFQFSCSVDMSFIINNIAHCRAVVWAQFYGPWSLFSFEFYFLFSSHLTLFKNVWFLDKIVKQTPKLFFLYFPFVSVYLMARIILYKVYSKSYDLLWAFCVGPVKFIRHSQLRKPIFPGNIPPYNKNLQISQNKSAHCKLNKSARCKLKKKNRTMQTKQKVLRTQVDAKYWDWVLH